VGLFSGAPLRHAEVNRDDEEWGSAENFLI
jgi:hypothetical protein